MTKLICFSSWVYSV